MSYIYKVKCPFALNILILIHVHVKIETILTEINKRKRALFVEVSDKEWYKKPNGEVKTYTNNRLESPGLALPVLPAANNDGFAFMSES